MWGWGGGGEQGVQVQAVINVHKCKCKIVNEVRETDENAAQTQQYPDPADSESVKICRSASFHSVLWCNLFLCASVLIIQCTPH